MKLQTKGYLADHSYKYIKVIVPKLRLLMIYFFLCHSRLWCAKADSSCLDCGCYNFIFYHALSMIENALVVPLNS